MEFIDLRSIAAEDIRDFLLERGATETCATCGGGDLVMIGPDGDSTASLLLNPNSNDSPDHPTTIPLAVVECRTCGCVRLHTYGTIARWKSAKLQ